MGAPLGNQNGRKGSLWRDALRAELATFEDKEKEVERGHALRRIARQVIRMAIDGEESAIREIGNRLDGKPVQTQEVGVTIDARLVVASYVAKLGPDGTRQLLELTGAKNLLPVLEQVEHEHTEG